MRALLALVLLASALPMFAARQIIGSEQDHSLAATTDCESFFKTTFTSFRSHLSDQDQREIQLTRIERLRVVGSEEGASRSAGGTARTRG